jgi:hypothetical protein
VDRTNTTYTLRLRGDTFEKALAYGFEYRMNHIVKKPGAYQLRVAVRDAISEKVGSASQFIEVPDLKKGRLALSGIVIRSSPKLPAASGAAALPGAVSQPGAAKPVTTTENAPGATPARPPATSPSTPPAAAIAAAPLAAAPSTPAAATAAAKPPSATPSATPSAPPAAASTTGTSAADAATLAKTAPGAAQDQQGDQDPLGSPALRIFRPGADIIYAFQLMNAQLEAGKPQLDTQLRLFRDAKLVYSGKPISINSSSQPDPKNLLLGGRFRLGAKLSPGEYIMQVVATDRLAKEKDRTAVQSVDFEVIAEQK